jgi:hypothetical protein
MLLPEGDEHRLQRLELGQFLPAHDLDDRLPLPLVAGKGRRVGRGGDATPGSVFTRRRHAARVPGLARALPSPSGPPPAHHAATPARWAHGSGGSRSPMPLAARMTGQFNAWSASDPRMSLRSSSESSDRARSARCPVACRSCWSLSPRPAAATRSCCSAARSWASAALRKARRLLVIAVRAAARQAAIWRCAEVSRSRTVARSASSCRFACSSLIRAWMASIRCLICSRRISRDCGSPPTLPACLLQAALPRMDKRQRGELGCLHGLLNSLNRRRRRQVLRAGPGPGWRTGG